MQTEFVFFCPQCASPSVDVSSIHGGPASCRSCKWSGTREDLFITPVTHDFTSSEHMLKDLIQQVVMVFAKNLVQPIGRILLNWGFMDKDKMSAQLPIYLRSMGAGAVQGILMARQFMEEQKTKVLVKNDNEKGA